MVTLATQGLAVTLGKRTVFRGLDLTLEPCGLIGVIGPNGAGKSTLARALLGLVPHKGRVTIDGIEIGRLPRGTLAQRLAYLPQGQTLHWPLTVERLVSLGRLPHLAPMSRISDVDRKAIDRAIQRADVEDLRHRNATELSGGERARVLLARALAVEADGLIADEPLASLDPGHQMDVMELLRAEAQNPGRLIVTILHDLTMAARYCDHLVLLDDGWLVAEGPPLEVLSEINLRRVYNIRTRIDWAEDGPLVIPLGR